MNKFLKSILATSLASASMFAISEEAIISGNVSSKCAINITTNGVYGNSAPNVLSTASQDGGVAPVIRFDVSQANYYKASITTPSSFLSSPSLIDSVLWTNSVEIDRVSDAGMSAYSNNKIEFGNTTEFPLTIAGSTWFKVNSKAEYGFNKAFPAGQYRAAVRAECIAQ